MAEARIKAWNGISVSDLPIDALNEYVVVETPLTLLKESVPIEYRAAQKAARVHGRPDNSLDWTQSTASIIAIDTQGMALVEQYVHSNYDGAEGWSFDIMPQQNAFDLLSDYRASHARAEKEISPETLEALQHLSEIKRLVDPAARIHAMPGRTYSGEIAALETGGSCFRRWKTARLWRTKWPRSRARMHASSSGRMPKSAIPAATWA
ncbi:hypothetical protein GG851_02840 [Bordetella petrii]|nr:hypothetical protein [Bordetella petrii]